jgi:hypothetical protein
MVPGIIPYGPYGYEEGTAEGPWDPRWGMTTTYPSAKLWPSHELWFENRYCPPTNEFTVHESIGPAAAAFGFLCAPGGKFTSVAQEKPPAVADYRLMQNYPNPFNPRTTIRFEVPRREHVKLKVYDLLGREVAALVDEMKSAGHHEVTFDASKVASGIYFYKLTAGEFGGTRRMAVVK